jgi:diguanylate cyclase (GGDEF)-like protein
MDNKTEAKLQALYVEYANKLPDKIQHIKLVWQKLRETWNDDNLKTLHREAHSLCGSASIYGFDALSKTARVLEIYLKNMYENKLTITAEIELEINQLLKNFDEALRVSRTVKPIEIKQMADYVTNKDKRETFFIVDQDENFIRHLRQSLTNESFDICVVDSIAALQVDIKNKLDAAAIIVDVDQIDATAIKRLSLLRQNQEMTSPLICISNNADLPTRLKSVRLGASAFYQKPFDIFLLIKMLSKVHAASEKESYRILIIDDNASLAEYHALILHQAGMVTRVITNPLNMMEASADFQPDLLLMDVYMPACTGFELATVLRQEPLYASLPVIFLSTEDDKLKQFFVMSAGGDDFLTKPILPEHLVASVRARAKRSVILSAFIMQDSLTQLLNHKAILDNLNVELTRAQHYQKMVSFLFIDIDHFKSVNDLYGHLVGDYVLRKTSKFLLEQLRRVDLVGRYGGEEFAVILPGADLTESKKIGEKIRDKFSQLKFNADDVEFNVTLSIGISSYPAALSSRDMVSAADKALYRAKNLGRNRVIHADEQ